MPLDAEPLQCWRIQRMLEEVVSVHETRVYSFDPEMKQHPCRCSTPSQVLKSSCHRTHIAQSLLRGMSSTVCTRPWTQSWLTTGGLNCVVSCFTMTTHKQTGPDKARILSPKIRLGNCHIHPDLAPCDFSCVNERSRSCVASATTHHKRLWKLSGKCSRTLE